MKTKIIAIIKSLPAGRAIYLCLLSFYKAIITPIRCRRLQRYGFKILGELNDVLTMHKIEYYVSYGTLLGIVRERNFLRHDDDIDIWVNHDNVKNVKEFVKKMSDVGFSFKHVLLIGDQILYYTFKRYQVSVDMFCFIRAEDGSGLYISGVYTDLNIKYEKPSQNSWRRIKRPNIDSGKEIECGGSRFVVPANAIEILEALYGKGWDIPNPNWVDEDTPQQFEYMPGFTECICDADAL